MKTKPTTIVLLLSVIFLSANACYDEAGHKENLDTVKPRKTEAYLMNTFDRKLRFPRDGEICTVSFQALAHRSSNNSGFGIITVVDGQTKPVVFWKYLDGKWQFDARGLSGLRECKRDTSPILWRYSNGKWQFDASAFRVKGNDQDIIPIEADLADKPVRLKIILDASGYWVYGTITEEGGKVYKSRVFNLPSTYDQGRPLLQLIKEEGSKAPAVDVDEIEVSYTREFAEGEPGLTQRVDPLTIITYSWTTADTKYLHDNIEEMEKRPLDGVVVRVAIPRLPHGDLYAGSGLGADWMVFQNLRLSQDVLDPAIEDLQTTNFKKFRSNYLSIISYLAIQQQAMDWFDDKWWDNIAHNARLMAEVAKKGGCEGIMFDPENYGCKFWDYSALATEDMYEGKSYEQVCQKVRQRGREFIAAINAGYPGVRIFILHAWEMLLLQGVSESYAGHSYGLLRNFFDGMLEASDDETILIDGIESGYFTEDPGDFINAVRRVKRYGPKIAQVPELFRKKVRTGFGIWLDCDRAWDPENIKENYWSPEDYEKIITSAANASDGFVWLYLERPTWWLDDSPNAKLGGGITFETGGKKNNERNKIIKPLPRSYWTPVENARKNAMKKRSAK